jgi:hypothetical protein
MQQLLSLLSFLPALFSDLYPKYLLSLFPYFPICILFFFFRVRDPRIRNSGNRKEGKKGKKVKKIYVYTLLSQKSAT